MAIYQIFVKLLDGRSRCLQIPSPTISGETLKRDLLAITNIPLESQRLVTGSLDISNETLISASPDGVFPSCTLLLRLRGGKGGFGSLLRGAATKAGQKKTNNFDACRDMSGRRLRHVNAEKKLEEWRAEAEDRKLEKLAEQFLRKKAKEVKKNSSVDVEKYLDKYREDSAKCMEEVEESVRQSFELYRDSKRKILPSSGPSKRMKIWLGKQTIDESESDDDEEDTDDNDDDGDEKSVVIDDGNCPSQNKESEGRSALGSVSGPQSDGESSGGGSAQSNLEEANGNGDIGSSPTEQEPGTGDGNSGSGGSAETETGTPDETVAQDTMVPSSEEVQGPNEYKVAEEICVECQLVSATSLEEVQNSVESEFPAARPVEPELVHKDSLPESTSASDIEELLNFDMYNFAAELEVVGMERLKAELQARGLKCGGTLQERAARLFLLKTIPLEKLPRKVLAKPAAAGGGKQ